MSQLREMRNAHFSFQGLALKFMQNKYCITTSSFSSCMHTPSANLSLSVMTSIVLIILCTSSIIARILGLGVQKLPLQFAGQEDTTFQYLTSLKLASFIV
jgi:hypothetical protein